ncbi:MAG: hypothetical protein AAFX05_01970 [Planctomycetota bacterium]
MGPPQLVINDGSLSALVACLMAGERSEVIAWVPPVGSALFTDCPKSPIALELVSRQSELLGYSEVLLAPETGPEWTTGTMEAAGWLLAACAEADRRGAERVIWPINCGSSLDDMQRAAELAEMVTRIATLDQPALGQSDFEVSLPLADLTNAEIREMAVDLDAPLDLCRDAQETAATAS